MRANGLRTLFSSHACCIPIYLYEIANMMMTDKAYAGVYLRGALCHGPVPFSKK